MNVANPINKALKKKLGKRRLFYVCRDAERAEAGLLTYIKNYIILANDSPYARKLKKKYPRQIVLVKSADTLDTLDMIKSADAARLIKKSDFILVFKPTVQIEAACNERGWTLLNPAASLANRVEEKMSQVEWLGELSEYLPKSKVSILKQINWTGEKFILQFNRAHTGSGTVLIESKKQLETLKKKFPEREARISKYIKGPMFTSNNVAAKDKILRGNVSYQITGLYPFTDNAFATIGNDWALPDRILSPKQRQNFSKIVKDVGKRLAKDGWQGLFGIDAIADAKTGRLYLIEINARQPASASFESILQSHEDLKGLNTFGAHLAALFNIPLKRAQLVKIKDGAQIVQRVTEARPSLSPPRLFKPIDFRYILYANTKPGSDLVRVQTRRGIMASHDKLNIHGNELSIFINSGRTGGHFNCPRAGAIIIKNGRILLLQRRRFGYDYWVVPGGSPEKNESVKATALREIKEETGLNLTLNKKPPIRFNERRDETYFFVKKFRGIARLGGPEKLNNSKDNHYSLKWVKFGDIKKINLLPPILKEKLIKYFANS